MRNSRSLAVLLVISAGLHFHALSEPRTVVFDEIHFGGFINAYSGSGAYFFDIHPPHGKLLIAGGAALGGYRGEQPFERIHAPLDRASPALLRSVPAIAGAALPLVVFALVCLLGGSRAAAFLAGLAVALDNGILLQTRLIAIDGPMLLSIFAALCAYLMMMREDRPLPRALWALGAGALAGLAAGCKMTGLAALGLIGICIAVSLLRDRSVEMLRRSLADGTLVLASASVVYLAGWMLHFALLDQPGPGDIWGKPTGSPWVDIPNTIGRIFTAARDITAGHPYASPWWSWPLMLRSVSYWSSGGHHLHFLGNPMVWWGSTLALAVIAITPYLVRTTDLSLPEGRSVWPENLWVVLCGWGLAFFPLALLTRVMFLYHYLTPLVFAVCAAVLWLDHIGWIRPGRLRDQRSSYYLAIAAIVAGFAAISPFTLPYVEAKAYQAALLAALPGWI